MRFLRALVPTLAALGLAGCAQARAQDFEGPRLGCDPLSWDEPMPTPPGQEIRCGDGVLGTYTAACSRSCAGGCPGVDGCSAVQCLTAHEVCDGAGLGGQTCRTLGFGGGRLRCAATCDALDTAGCEVCFSGRGTRCSEASVEGPVEGLRLVPGPRGALAVWRHGAGMSVALLDPAPTLRAPVSLPGAGALDAVPLVAGWRVAAVGDGAVSLVRIDAEGAGHALETLPGATSARLWTLDDGGAVLTTGGTRGAPFRVFDASGAPVAAPAMPAHAQRADGGRLMLLDLDCHGVLAEPQPRGMHVEWTPEPGDLTLAFTGPRQAGVHVVRDGALLLGMGTIADDTPTVAVHCGPIPAASGRTSDALWAGAVPDEASTPGSGMLRLGAAGGRFRDGFEPHEGRARWFEGRIAPPVAITPRRPIFATHPSVTTTAYARVGRRVLGLATGAGTGHDTRLVVGRQD